MKDFRALAQAKEVVSAGRPRLPDSIWHVEAIVPAKRDADRLFRRMPTEALVVAIDQSRTLALFPDTQPCVEGDVLDLNFQRVQGEVFYRLRVDDALFGGRSLRVFFWPQKGAGTNDAQPTPGTMWIVGLAWRPDAYRSHMRARCRRRIREIVGQARGG